MTPSDRRGDGSIGRPKTPDGHGALLLANTTQVPNVIIDDWMTTLSGAELKVVMYVTRRTFGFRKLADQISVRQIVSGIRKRDGTRLDSGTGLSRAQVIRVLRSLVDKGIVIREDRTAANGASQAAIWRLNLTYRAPAPRKTRHKGSKIDRSQNETPQGRKTSLSRVSKVDRQNPEVQNLATQYPVDGVSVGRSDTRASLGSSTGRDGSTDRDPASASREPMTMGWHRLDTELANITETSDDAILLAADVLDILQASRRPIRDAQAARLAQWCLTRGTADLARMAAQRTAATTAVVRSPWPHLLTSLLDLDRAERDSAHIADRVRAASSSEARRLHGRAQDAARRRDGYDYLFD